MRSGADAAVEGVPAFLAKLWKLVDEPRTNQLISWGEDNKSFVIKDQIEFSRKLLPLYYKHNNMASFIRQLNMYGFHKVVSVDTGSLRCDNEEIQFSHPCFMRGHVGLMKHIKRKIANSKAAAPNGDEKALLKPEMMSKVLTDVKHMKGRQESLDERFGVMKHENEALWREVALLRQKHTKQQQIVNNLIQFLMSIVQNSRSGPLKTGVKRHYRLMIDDAAHNSRDQARGNKSPRLDSDNDMEDEGEFLLPEMVPEEGPVILEVGDQEHTSEGPSYMLTTIKSELQPSPGAGQTPSPAPSSIPEAYEAAIDDLEESGLPSLLFDNMPDAVSPIQIQAPSPKPVNMSIEGLNMPAGSPKKKSTARDASKVKAGKSILSPTFSLTSTQAPTTLPTNIFDSDETNSQEEPGISLSDVDQQATFSLFNQNADSCEPGDDEIIDSLDLSNSMVKGKGIPSKKSNTTSEDGLVNSITSGNYNPNILFNANSKVKGKNKASNGKSKDFLLQNIKEEIPNLEDDSMTLAMLPQEKTRPVLNRFNSVEDVDDHLSSMQTDIENLRELLSGDYTLDANTLLGLFGGQNEPFYGLSLPNTPDVEKTKESVDESNQLISYVPPISNLGFDDFELDDDDIGQQPAEEPATTENPANMTLNTPQVQLLEPKFP